ncbi:NUDIX hydrolase [Ensifer adhaerens]|uniref:NUDIX hydrolase n=1 Tax=Ensifer adhaerens TaxID=106592 RepID=UPI000CF165C4|nr:NUDIX hydrolase [Ensifer adhaerens]
MNLDKPRSENICAEWEKLHGGQLPAPCALSEGWVSIPYVGRYQLQSTRDRDNASAVLELLSQRSDPFGRDSLPGHITASAFIINPRRDAVLLTHHAKLDCWLPLGGHCDGIRDPRFSALRECYEESGLKCIVGLQQDLFDIDIHDIPASGSMPQHTHYDLRFLLQADDSAPLKLTSESKALHWVGLEQLPSYTDRPSVLVLTRKLSI